MTRYIILTEQNERIFDKTQPDAAELWEVFELAPVGSLLLKVVDKNDAPPIPAEVTP